MRFKPLKNAWRIQIAALAVIVFGGVMQMNDLAAGQWIWLAGTVVLIFAVLVSQ